MILIVGNILKDVYLNLDSRTENFETDKNGTRWLDFSFDASSHHFFHRVSIFGGAAVSLEIFQNFKIPASISCADFNFYDEKTAPASAYRYILISEDDVTYLTPSRPTITHFAVPDTQPDYIFVDRSANLDASASTKISAYLDEHPKTELILYFKNPSGPYQNLVEKSTLIFSEDKSQNLPHNKTIYLSDHNITFGDDSEPVTAHRVDKLTRLSFYSIISATIVACFIKDYTVAKSLHYAKINVENSNLDSTLSPTEIGQSI